MFGLLMLFTFVSYEQQQHEMIVSGVLVNLTNISLFLFLFITLARVHIFIYLILIIDFCDVGYFS